MASAETSLHRNRDKGSNRVIFQARGRVTWHPENLPNRNVEEHNINASVGMSKGIGMQSRKNKGGKH